MFLHYIRAPDNRTGFVVVSVSVTGPNKAQMAVMILPGSVSLVPADDETSVSTAVGTDHANADKKPSTDRILSLLSLHELGHTSPASTYHCF